MKQSLPFLVLWAVIFILVFFFFFPAPGTPNAFDSSQKSGETTFYERITVSFFLSTLFTGLILAFYLFCRTILRFLFCRKTPSQ